MAHRYRIKVTGPRALAVGVVLLGIGFYQYLTSSTLAYDGVRAEAVVTDVDSRYRRNSGRAYALTLEFRDRSGVQQTARTGYSTRHRGTRTGERLEILYNPRDPSEFAFPSFLGLWGLPLGFGAAGTFACAVFLFGPRRG